MDQLLNFDTIADQGLRERFDLILAEVLANLADPNTDPKVKRSIAVTITFKATEDRSVEEHSIAVISKKAPYKPMHASGFLERIEDGPVVSAVRTIPVQTELEWSAN